MQKTVATPRAEVIDMQDVCHAVRTVYRGTTAMRNAGRTYLPQEEGESELAYKSRLSRTVLFNATRKTVQDMAGRVFAKEIQLEGGSANFTKWIENIDGTGRHLNTFAGAVFQDALVSGVAYIVADTPEMMEGATRANEGKPYLVHLTVDDVIGWTYEPTEDGLKLTSFRYYETAEVIDDEIHSRTIRQIKVLLPGAWQRWRENAKKEWELDAEGTRGIAEIPVVPVYTNQTGFMTGEPPLRDLADLNITHWQSSSDQRNILHVARVPILFLAGVQEDVQLLVGAGSLTRANDPAATMAYVEHSGAAIGSGKDDLKELEFQMQAMGLQLLQAEPSQTATGEVRDDVKENSRLARMADGLKDGLENALRLMGELGGVSGQEPDVMVNKDFGITARGAVDIQAILAAWTAGLISAETAINEMVRRGFLSDTITPDEEAQRILDEPSDDEGDMRDALPSPTGVTP